MSRGTALLAAVLLLCVSAPASPASSHPLGSASRCCERASPGCWRAVSAARQQLFLRGGGAAPASPIRPGGSTFNGSQAAARGVPDFLSFVSGVAAPDGGMGEESGGLRDEAEGGERGYVDFAGMSALRCGIDSLLAKCGEGGRLAMLEAQAPAPHASPPAVNPAWRAS
ncbi:hypothetical protein T484DRAFT_1779409 [Baffinella frigidus]|nr:hypothetical protein T484DRAFT_1779409 [Cryptophyta sp. CCMP2293]